MGRYVMGEYDELDRAQRMAAASAGSAQPRVLAQIVVTLIETPGGPATNLQYTCDEMTARALLDKGRSILDFKVMEDMREQQSRIARPGNGDLKRFGV